MVDWVLVRGAPLPLRNLVRAQRVAAAPEHGVRRRLVPEAAHRHRVADVDKVAHVLVPLVGVGRAPQKGAVRGRVQVGLVHRVVNELVVVRLQREGPAQGVRGKVDHHVFGGRREDLQQLVADHVGGPAADAHEQVLADVERGALRPPHADDAVPVRVVEDADVVAVELHLPLPVVDDEGPLLHGAVGRAHEPRVLLVHLVEPVALLGVDAGLRGAHGPEPVPKGHLVEQPVDAVEEPSGTDIVLLGGLDLLDHREPVDVLNLLEGCTVDVRRQRLARLPRELPQLLVVSLGAARRPSEQLARVPRQPPACPRQLLLLLRPRCPGPVVRHLCGFYINKCSPL